MRSRFANCIPQLACQGADQRGGRAEAAARRISISSSARWAAIYRRGLADPVAGTRCARETHASRRAPGRHCRPRAFARRGRRRPRGLVAGRAAEWISTRSPISRRKFVHQLSSGPPRRSSVPSESNSAVRSSSLHRLVGRRDDGRNRRAMLGAEALDQQAFEIAKRNPAIDARRAANATTRASALTGEPSARAVAFSTADPRGSQGRQSSGLLVALAAALAAQTRDSSRQASE